MRGIWLLLIVAACSSSEATPPGSSGSGGSGAGSSGAGSSGSASSGSSGASGSSGSSGASGSGSGSGGSSGGSSGVSSSGGGSTSGSSGGGAPDGGRGPASRAVWTNRYDNQRTGATTVETTLTPATVGGGKFGLLFTRTVDGTIQAQPLYVPGLTIKGAAHNVVLVATENNSVYAFDADDPAASAPLWWQSMGPAIPMAGSTAFACKDLQPVIGITSTPVIDTSNTDPNAWTLYVEAKTLEGGAFHHKLHALDVTSGAERRGSPVEITATVPGTGDGSVGGMIAFNPEHQLQRTGLLLDQGRIYMGFASHCDAGAYHGWVMAYDAATLQQKGLFITTPSTGRGGIWQSGMGLSTDGTGVFFVAGNSTKMVQPSPGKEYGLSAGRLTLSGGTLSVADWWTESDFVNLNQGDYDLTSAAIIDSGSNLAFVGGKDARIHVLDRAHMGNFAAPPGPDPIVQTVPVVVTNPIQYKSGHMHGSPVLWNGPKGLHVYVWPEQSPLQDYAVNPATKPPVNPTPVGKGMMLPPHPGGMLTISSDGAKAGTGVLWAALVPNPMLDAWHSLVPGALYAFDAEDVSKPPLWTSDTNMSRDALGLFAKFCPPTVASGRVYIGTATTTNALHVYGLMP